MIWALHGAAGSAGDWDGLREKGLALRAVSLSGEVADYGEWAKAFCERVREEDPEPSVMGYSMGGRLAMHALLEEPGMWRSGIIVSAHPGIEDENDRREREEADAVWARRFREDDDLEEVLRDWDSRPVLAGLGMQRDLEEVRRWRRAIGDSLEVWSLGRQEALRERLGEVACPVLWVTGARDGKFTGLGQAAVARLPRGELSVIDDCGHRVAWEQKDVFAKEVIEFQNRVAMGAGQEIF